MTPLYGAILNNILNNSWRQEKHEKKMDQKHLVLTLTFDNFFVDFPRGIQI